MTPRREPEPTAPALPTAQEVASWASQGRIATAVLYPIPPLRDAEGGSAIAELEESAPSAAASGWIAPPIRAGVQLRAEGRLVGAITGPAVVGRAPSITGVQTITVDDKDRSVSRNHLRLDLDARGAVIACDLGSANGTELIGADGERVTFTPGKWYPVALGSTIVVGDLALEVV